MKSAANGRNCLYSCEVFKFANTTAGGTPSPKHSLLRAMIFVVEARKQPQARLPSQTTYLGAPLVVLLLLVELLLALSLVRLGILRQAGLPFAVTCALLVVICCLRN